MATKAPAKKPAPKKPLSPSQSALQALETANALAGTIQGGTSTTPMGKYGQVTIPGAANLLGITGSTLTGDQAVGYFENLAQRDPRALAQIQSQMFYAGLYGSSHVPEWGHVSAQDIRAFANVIEKVGAQGIDINQWLNEQSVWSQALGNYQGNQSLRYLNYPQKASIDAPAALQETLMQTMLKVQGRMPTQSEMANFTSYMQNAEHQAAVQDYEATSRYTRQLAQQNNLLAQTTGGQTGNINWNWVNGTGAKPSNTPNPQTIPGPNGPSGPSPLKNPSPSPAQQILRNQAQTGKPVGSKTPAKSQTPQAQQGRYIDPTSAMHFSQQAAQAFGATVTHHQLIPVGNQQITQADFTIPVGNNATEFERWARSVTGPGGLFTSINIQPSGSGNVQVSLTYSKNAGPEAQNAILNLGSAAANPQYTPAATNKAPDANVVDIINPDPASQAFLRAWNTDPSKALAEQQIGNVQGGIEAALNNNIGPQNNPTAGAA